MGAMKTIQTGCAPSVLSDFKDFLGWQFHPELFFLGYRLYLVSVQLWLELATWLTPVVRLHDRYS